MHGLTNTARRIRCNQARRFLNKASAYSAARTMRRCSMPWFILLTRKDAVEVLRDENDPAGSSHCAQLDPRRYAQDDRRLV
jgi:hypothetical protein